MPSAKWLSYYSRVFDFVEIDSTFYRIPNALTTRNWAKATPDNFKFAAKMPSAATHEKRLGSGIDIDLRYFYDALTPLQDKLAAVLIQLPPSMTKKEGFKKLQAMPLDERFAHALEVRHRTWFDDEVYDWLRANGLCLVWSQLAEMQTPPVATADYLYLRFIGDRSIPDNEFGRIQKDRLSEMQYWANELQHARGRSSLRFGIVAANNHYAGFGAATANTFRKLMSLPVVSYYETGYDKQPTMLDY